MTAVQAFIEGEHFRTVKREDANVISKHTLETVFQSIAVNSAFTSRVIVSAISNLTPFVIAFYS